MEPSIDVANIFCIKFYTNWSIWIAEPSTIFGSIFQRINWYRSIGSTLAMVIFSEMGKTNPHWKFITWFANTHFESILFLFCRSCFLTSSLIGTIGMTLQIPLAMLFDVVFKSKTFSTLFYFGTIPMCGSLIFVGILMKNEDSDPLLRFIKIFYRKLCQCRRPNVVRYVEKMFSLFSFF